MPISIHRTIVRTEPTMPGTARGQGEEPHYRYSSPGYFHSCRRRRAKRACQMTLQKIKQGEINPRPAITLSDITHR